jgi:hypothetical protein
MNDDLDNLFVGLGPCCVEFYSTFEHMIFSKSYANFHRR